MYRSAACFAAARFRGSNPAAPDNSAPHGGKSDKRRGKSHRGGLAAVR